MATAPEVHVPLMSAQQLLELPDDGLRHELVEGRAERASEALVPGFPALAPDLVAEVVSPSDRVVEVAAKAQEWLDAGVRLVWVVDAANRTVTTYRADRVSVLRGDGVLSGEDVLTGFTVPLADLWV